MQPLTPHEKVFLTILFDHPHLLAATEGSVPFDALTPVAQEVYSKFAEVWETHKTLPAGIIGAVWAHHTAAYYDFVSYVTSPRSTTAPDDLQPCLKEVQDVGARRGMLRWCANLAVALTKNEKVETACANALQSLTKITRHQSNDPVHIWPLTIEAQEKQEKIFHGDQQDCLNGLSWGYPSLDKLTKGLAPGEVIVVAGRPGMGKTTFALNIAHRNLHPTLFFSLEMSALQLARRLVNSELGYEADVRAQQAPPPPLEQYARWKDWPFYVDVRSSPTPEYIYFQTSKMVATKGIKLVVVDYVQLISPPQKQKNATRDREVAAISATLKNLARDFQLPVLVLSQLNRRIEQRDGGLPMLSDLRDSGALEQDADIVMFITTGGSPPVFKTLIRKNRNGPLGESVLTYNPSASSITGEKHDSKTAPF